MDYSGDLKSKIVRILNGQKQVGLQMAPISNGILNLEAHHLKSGQKYLDFQCSVFKKVVTIVIAIVKARPFEI